MHRVGATKVLLSAGRAAGRLVSSTSLWQCSSIAFRVNPRGARGRPMSTSSGRYDLVCIGSGPACQKAAISAAKMGKKVAIVDGKGSLGGVCVHTGTIPSKTMREAIMTLSGYRQRKFYGFDYNQFDLSAMASTADSSMINDRIRQVIREEAAVVYAQLRRNHVDIIPGKAHFDGHQQVVVESPGQDIRSLMSENFLIGVGTRPAESSKVVFDGKHVLDADMLLDEKIWANLPNEVIVVGAGIIGIEYASMLVALPHVKVTVVDERPQMLDFVDREIVDSLYFMMRKNGATFRMAEAVQEVNVNNGKVTALLGSGKKLQAGALLYAIGRQGNTDTLNLDSVGLTPDKRGKLTVNEYFQTDVPNIYAAGDVIGAPALASSSFEQGRLVAQNIFGNPKTFKENLFPFGIYTIPEISMVGRTEEDLTACCIPYESGVARYADLARGLMIGDTNGMLKILFCPDTLKIYGIHAFGESATEIIHLGQSVMALGGTLQFFRDSVFNYPTLAEAYKVAAHQGLNKLGRGGL